MKLRDYQAALIEKLRAAVVSGKRAPLLVSPCGSGKTVVFAYLAGRIGAAGRRVLILAHRAELIDQITGTLSAFHVPYAVVASGQPYEPLFCVQVAMVGTYVRRMDRYPPPHTIIIDEAHHATASTWKNIFARYPDARRIGVTATPTRLSGEPLGDIFDEIILGPEMSELIAAGHLSDYVVYARPSVDTSKIKTVAGDYNKNQLALAMEKSTIYGDAVREYERFASGKRAIVFCISVDHAEAIAEMFQRAGHAARSIDGSMSSTERAEIIKSFKLGAIKILTSCDIVSEGFDLPAIECAIMLRPTQSLALWIQQAGRALRPFPGKGRAIILDHAGNTERHGFPDDPREWTLHGRKKKSKKLIRIKECPECLAACPGMASSCEYCGFIFPRARGREVAEIDGELEELKKLPYNERMAKLKTFADFQAFGKAMGYKPGWAFHAYTNRKSTQVKLGFLGGRK